MNVTPPTNFLKRAGAGLVLVSQLAQGAVATEAKHLGEHRPNIGELAGQLQPLKKDTLHLAQVPSVNPNAVPFNQQGTTGQTGTVTAECQKALNIYNTINAQYSSALAEFQQKQREKLEFEATIPQQRLQAIYSNTDATDLQTELEPFYQQRLQGYETQLQSLQSSNDTLRPLAEAKYTEALTACNTPVTPVSEPLQESGTAQ
jgi:hypothetical protein